MRQLARILAETRDGIPVARLEGEVDMTNAQSLGERLRGLLTNRSVALVVDLGPTTYLDSSGITLLKGDLMGIVRARRVSESTMRNIRQNLFFAFVYNVAGIPLAAGVLYPFFGILLSPVVAAAAMALSSVSVIANSLRLRAANIVD